MARIRACMRVTAEAAARDGKVARHSHIFPGRSSNDDDEGMCLFAPGRGAISLAKRALGKTIVSTGNPGLRFNLKEARIRRADCIA